MERASTIKCDRLGDDGTCLVAAKLSGSVVSPRCNVGAFAACQECRCPFAENHVTASLAHSELMLQGKLTESVRRNLAAIIRGGKECLHESQFNGPGGILLAFMVAYGEEGRSCQVCLDRVRQMNEWGRECRNHASEIVGWLESSAKEKMRRFWKPGAYAVVMSAITIFESQNSITPLGAVEWCERNIGQVLSWIRQESSIMSIPFAASVAHGMIIDALSRAKKSL